MSDGSTFSSGVQGTYEAPRVSRITLGEGGNYVNSASAGDGIGTLSTSIIE